MSAQVEDKKGNAIDEGDRAFTKIRGGKREGEVSIYLEYYLLHSENLRSKI
jgi:predicted HAD superfamily phosphohydrolase YqeG